MLPQILKQVTDVKSGAKFLSGLGVDKSFIGNQFSKYSPFLSRIPGMSDEKASSMVNDLTSLMPEASRQSLQSAQGPGARPVASNYAPIDRSRYPKIK